MDARRRGVLALAGCVLAALVFVPLLDLASRRGWLPDAGPPPHFRPVRGADGRALADAQAHALWSVNPDVAASLAGGDGDRLATAREKGSGVYRVLSIGESTTFATGYRGRASYSRFLEMRLRARFDRSTLEVVNCGKNGYDSHDWPTLAQELDGFAPDALVLYVGHNEFKRPNLLGVLDPFVGWLQRSPRARRLLGPAPDRAVEPAAVRVGPFLTTEQRARALADFVAGVRALLDVAARRRIPAIVCIPASNVLDHAPRCSVVPAGPGAEALAAEVKATAAKWDAGEARLAGTEAPARDAALADLAALDALSKRAPGAALLHWRRGRILHALQRDEEAARAFESSLALDELPERASPDLVAALRALATETGATVADCEARFAREARGAPGFDLFFDYCHPKLYGHYLVADELVRAFESLPAPARPGVGSDAREPLGDFAARYSAYSAALHFTEEDAARQNFGQATLLVNELATNPDAPSENWERPREFLDDVVKQSAAFEGDAEFLVVRAMVRAACGTFEAARADLAAANAADATRVRTLGASIGRLPGAVAAFARAGIAVGPDGFR
jgi:hypothetical protein